MISWNPLQPHFEKLNNTKMHNISILKFILAFSFLFYNSCALTPLDELGSPGNLTGRYRSDLGAQIDLKCSVASDGTAAQLTGWYYCKNEMAWGTYPLSGQATNCGADAQLAFAVAWSNEAEGNNYAASAWSAQAYPANPLMLFAIWTMTSKTPSNGTWKSINVNYDEFVKEETSSSTISV
jgi:hypothetical protein